MSWLFFNLNKFLVKNSYYIYNLTLLFQVTLVTLENWGLKYTSSELATAVPNFSDLLVDWPWPDVYSANRLLVVVFENLIVTIVKTSQIPTNDSYYFPVKCLRIFLLRDSEGVTSGEMTKSS